MTDSANYVYPLYHYTIEQGVSTLDIDDEDPSLITTIVGVYSTRANAEAAIERVRDNPRFRDWPGEFVSSGPNST